MHTVSFPGALNSQEAGVWMSSVAWDVRGQAQSTWYLTEPYDAAEDVGHSILHKEKATMSDM